MISGELKRRANLRAPSTTTESPEELWIVAFRDLLELAVRRDNFKFNDVIDLHSNPIHKRVMPTRLHPAAEDAHALETLAPLHKLEQGMYVMLSAGRHEPALVSLIEEHLIVHAARDSRVGLLSGNRSDRVELWHRGGHVTMSFHLPLVQVDQPVAVEPVPLLEKLVVLAAARVSRGRVPPRLVDFAGLYVVHVLPGARFGLQGVATLPLVREHGWFSERRHVNTEARPRGFPSIVSLAHAQLDHHTCRGSHVPP